MVDIVATVVLAVVTLVEIILLIFKYLSSEKLKGKVIQTIMVVLFIVSSLCTFETAEAGWFVAIFAVLGYVLLSIITSFPVAIITISKIYIIVVPLVLMNDFNSQTLFATIAVFAGIAIVDCVYLMVRDSALKHEKTHYCFKCRKDTEHNYFGVCTSCYSDVRAMLGYTLLCFFVCIIMCLVLIGGDGEVKYNETWKISLLMIVSFFYKIYMYPAVMARRTEQPASNAIYWLNLLFGFTGIMWLILLMWGSSGRGFGRANRSEERVTNQQLSEQIKQISMPVQQSTEDKSVIKKFEELKTLKEMGMITDEEFEEKRKEFISKM